MEPEDLRARLLRIALAMVAQGLNRGSSGNLSLRLPDGEGFLITPSALPYARCREEDMVRTDWHGHTDGPGKPSSEWRMHRDIYRRYPEARAVLHAHSPCCTSLACLERPIPAFHYMVARAGGDSIRCAPYALFGSQALSDAALTALEGRRAALLGHHGMVCFDRDLDQVLDLAQEVEDLARAYLQCLQVVEPPLLSREEMAAVLERFQAYRP